VRGATYSIYDAAQVQPARFFLFLFTAHNLN